MLGIEFTFKDKYNDFKKQGFELFFAKSFPIKSSPVLLHDLK